MKIVVHVEYIYYENSYEEFICLDYESKEKLQEDFIKYCETTPYSAACASKGFKGSGLIPSFHFEKEYNLTFYTLDEWWDKHYKEML